jgi:hypothetical protein
MLVNVIALGAVTPVVFWREACGLQKPPDVRHVVSCGTPELVFYLMTGSFSIGISSYTSLHCKIIVLKNNI